MKKRDRKREDILVRVLSCILLFGPYVILMVHGLNEACTLDNPTWLCIKLFPSHYR